ncbi:MAG: Gldg family protein [Planctomycetaceae bacterium]|nr:Gldg family protein [Planctomycetaceae bacterium]
MNLTVVSAIFRRNFSSYFSNPTGYVFICVFVLLSSAAAFWPNDFFVNNLANLDSLNKILPLILLIFIPAITMGIWAEERKQGTDELLLTIPATDLDVVVGKFLAGVSIYTVALVFSAVCNFIVLEWLGDPDFGLFVATYLGYWFMGNAMLSIGMIGSFLTGNVTIAFILGALFNAPLAFAMYSDAIMPNWLSRDAQWWSLSEQFRDLGRGVISLPSVAYFVGITAVMLYLSMILMGRRHWTGGRQAGELSMHFFARVIAVALIVASLVVLASRTGVRSDITAEQISSLSKETRELIRKLDAKHNIQIDAYVSPEVPESYVQVRLNLLSALREFAAIGGSKIRVQIHDTPALSAEADAAEKLYGITAREVITRNRGVTSREEIYLGVAFKSALEKVVVPFFDFGIPAEYEIARSIATVANEKRKVVGVLQTDAQMFGGFNPQSMSQTQDSLLIEELRKQFQVKQVNPTSPITEKYDVLLAVQPSSLGVQELDNFITAVKQGQPTAIFEDPFPFPYLNPSVPGTLAPKQPPGGQMAMFGGQQPPQPKGNIDPLWNLLGVSFNGNNVIWQRYNPYQRFPFDPEFVFVDEGANPKAFNEVDPASKGIEQLLFLYPGSIGQLNSSNLKFNALVTTGDKSGVVGTNEVWQRGFMGGGGPNPAARRQPRSSNYVLAAHITGTVKQDQQMADEKAASDAATKAAETAEPKKTDTELNVMLVADIDCLAPDFFGLRSQTGNPERADFNLTLDNVTFVLNLLDELSGDTRFIPIRSRRPHHRTLVRVEEVTGESRKAAAEEVDKLKETLEANKKETRAKFEEQIKKLQERKDVDPQQLLIEVATLQETNQRKQQVADEAAQKDFERKRKEIERKLALDLAAVHRQYKLWAVILPPIPPLLVGLGVFFNRRAREREGVSRARLR